MGWTADYIEEDVVSDLTKPLKKIWDNLMPKVFPHILEFDTKRVSEVNMANRVGPYTAYDHFIDYECYVKIDNKPLIENGWDGGKITEDLAKKSYGELYFHDLRGKMAALTKYTGKQFSNFDAGGEIQFDVDDI